MALVQGLRDLRREFGSREGLQAVPIGVVCGLITTVFSLSYAALLFSGALSANIGAGMGMMLVSSAAMAIFGALLTSYRPIYAQVRDIPLAYLALIAPAVAATATGDATLPTMVVIVAITTLAVGVSFFLVGSFRLGRVVRFVPFAVVSGFLAGVAWLIVTGSITILTGEAFEWRMFVDLLAPEQLPKVATVAAVVILGTLGRRLMPSGLLVPIIVVAATVLFHIATRVVGLDGHELTAMGWLAELPKGEALWPPITPSELGQVDWGVVLGNWSTVGVIVLVTMIALLLNVSGLEIEARRDIDLDAELRTAGVANVFAALGGGAPGYQSLSMTILSQRLGGGTRGVSLVAGLFIVAVLFFASDLIALVPLPVLAGIVVATGGGLLWERLVLSYHTLPITEYLIVVGIFAITVSLGFLTAVVAGIVGAMALFVFDYSRAGVVKLELTGRDYQSSSDGSEDRRRILREHGDAILIMRLQGFLFFGTANGLRRAVEARLRRSIGRQAALFVLLDFRRISGIDSAAVQSFARLAETAREIGAIISLANVPAVVLRTLVRGGLPVGEGSAIQVVDSFETTLAWAEHTIISGVDPTLATRAPRPIGDQLRAFADDPAEIARISAYLERLDVAAGALLAEEGTAADRMYFVESGSASVRIRTEGHDVMLATLGPGSILGEIAFYLGAARTASVTADTPMVLWAFNRDALRRMEEQSPAAAARFHRGMAEVLADRLSATNRLVRFLAA